MKRALGLVVVLGLLAGCSGKSGSAPSKAVHDKADIVAAIGATSDDGGMSYRVPLADGSSCGVAVIMTDAAQVKLYAGAGDTVAMNPAKTVGLKVTDDREATCLAGLTTKLAAVK